MQKILVPVDFSAVSVEACRFAFDMAARSEGASVLLLHAIALPSLHDSPLLPVAAMKKELFREYRDLAEARFTRLIGELNTNRIPAETRIVAGQLQTGILTAIENSDIDLVVMGTNGARGIREWTIGSHTEKIVRTSPCPVLSIKKPTNTKLKNIVFPTKLDTANQDQLVREIKALQEFFQARLHIIWVNTPAVFTHDADVRRKLKTFADHHQLGNYTINVFNYRDEEAGIREFTRQINGDLIALATRGFTGLSHLINGSVAEDLVNHLPWPVWTYRARVEAPLQKTNSI